MVNQLSGPSGRSRNSGEQPSLEEVRRRAREHPYFSSLGPFFGIDGVEINIVDSSFPVAAANKRYAGEFAIDRDCITVYDFDTGTPFIAPESKQTVQYLEQLGFARTERDGHARLVGQNMRINERKHPELSQAWRKALEFVEKSSDVNQYGGRTITGMTYTIPGEAPLGGSQSADTVLDSAAAAAIQDQSDKPGLPARRSFLARLTGRSKAPETPSAQPVQPATSQPPASPPEPVVHRWGFNDLGVDENKRHIGSYNLDPKERVAVWVTVEGETKLGVNNASSFTMSQVLESRGYVRDETLKIPFLQGEEPVGEGAAGVRKFLEEKNVIPSGAAHAASASVRLAHRASAPGQGIVFNGDVQDLAVRCRAQLGIPDGATGEQIERARNAAIIQAHIAGAPELQKEAITAAAGVVLHPSAASAKQLLVAMQRAQSAQIGKSSSGS